MAFEKMKDMDQDFTHERSCILLYHFTPDELKQLQMVATLTGIKDKIVLKPENSNTLIKNILDNEILDDCEEHIVDKAIIFNNISSARLTAFIEGLKKCRMSRPLIAVVTPTSINWTLKELLFNLAEERSAIKNNKLDTHH